MDSFWADYREWVIEMIDSDIHMLMIPEDMNNGWDEDENGQYYGLRKLAEDRESRAEREEHKIQLAERVWETYVSAQNAKKDLNHTALITSFQSMPKLRRVEIAAWACDLTKHGFCPRRSGAEEGEAIDDVTYENYGDGWTDKVSDDVGYQFSHYRILWDNFQMIAEALLAARQHVQELFLPSVDPNIIRVATPAAQHLFSWLTRLTLRMTSHDFLLRKDLEDPPQPLSPIATLIHCAKRTLQYLDIGFCEYFVRIEGECTLAPLFFEPVTEHGRQSFAPIKFPRLKELGLASIIVCNDSLTAFLAAQPKLKTAAFNSLCLGTPNSTWASVASALPSSCESWYVNSCRYNSFPHYEIPVTPKWFAKFKPYTDANALPPSCGWRVKDPFCDSDSDPRLWFYQQGGKIWTLHLSKNRGRIMPESRKQGLVEAAFERI